MTQGELAAALGLPARLVRYLVAQRIIAPALTLGRGAGGYDDRHVADGRRYLQLAAESPNGRVSAAEARARLGFPYGHPGAVPDRADFGAFAAEVPPGAPLDDAAIDRALGRARAWLRALRDARAEGETGAEEE